MVDPYRTLGDLKKVIDDRGDDVVAETIGSEYALVLVPEDGEFPVAGHQTQRWNTRELEENVDDTEAGGRVSPWMSMASPDCLVIPLSKRAEANPFHGVISIGRAANNDIQLTATSVSKLHALLIQGEPNWQVSDKASSNGTRVNNVPLASNVERPIQPGDELRFGGVRCMFVDASGLKTLVQLMVRPI